MTDPGSPPPGPWRDEGSARSEAPPLPRRTPAATRASWPSPPASAAAPPPRPPLPSPFRQPPAGPTPGTYVRSAPDQPLPPAPRPAPDLERQPVAVAAGPADPGHPRTASELPRRSEPDRPAYGTTPGPEPVGHPFGARPPSGPQPGDHRPPPSFSEPPQGPTGAVSLGLGRGSRERELVRRVGVPLPGTRKVVVLSIKGGVGKTTTVAVTGSMLAGLRRDKVVALDASSDWGTLAARLSVVPRQSVREMAARGRHAVSESGVLAQLSSSPSGLLVVGSDPQSAVSAALGEDEYLQAMHLLDYVAGVVVTDVGAGLQQPFLAAALKSCDQLVVASAATWDAAQSAGAALDWLSARGHGHLVESGLVVMNNLYPARRRRQGFIRDMKADLSRRARSVHEIPFDPALQPGGRILLRKLSASTRQAYLEVAADIMSGLAAAPPRA